MERSLDLDRLIAVLAAADTGSVAHFADNNEGPLPSPERLQSLLAHAEVELFLARLKIDSKLLETAWYLHGIASADRALELYSVERQRQAFAVSAHIFDLACNDASQSFELRLSQAFAAQVGFHRSEGEPNATALGRRVEDWDASKVNDADEIYDCIPGLAIKAGILVLSLNPSISAERLRRWRFKLRKFASRIRVEDLGSTIFGPTYLVVEAANHILRHLIHGDVGALELARSELARAVSNEHSGNDHDARWVAAQLRFVVDEMSKGSVWNVFPAETPAAAKQAFTLTAPRILTLWEPQRQLLEPESQRADRLHVTPLATESRRLVLSVPTSAGKTLMAQLLMINQLATNNSGVCYVAPQRSLGREVRKALSRRLQMISREVGRVEPDYGLPASGPLADFFRQMDDPFSLATVFGEVISPTPEPEVSIMTPERLAHALRNDAESVLARYGMFVFDEAHQVHDNSRGFLLESIISFLNWRTLTTSHRIVLLSAAMGNAGQIQQWIDPEEIGRLFKSKWRGPRRLSVLVGTEIDRDNLVVTPVAARGARSHLTQKHTFPLFGVLRLKPAGEKEVKLKFEEPVGEIVFRADSRGNREYSPEKGESTSHEKMLARMTLYFGHAGPVLIVCTSRPIVQRVASHLAEHLDNDPKSAILATTARIKLGDEHPLSKVLVKGVAFHHAGLPTDILEGIEEGVRTGKVTYIVSTSTLTDGVNLPVHTVVIHSPSFNGIEQSQLVTGARLVNAIGRAGRAAQETEGWVVMSHFARARASDFNQLAPVAELPPVISTLISDSALHDLEIFESEYRNNEDVLFSARGKAADFQSFVWHLLTTEDLAGRNSGDLILDDALQHTLGFLQMSEELRERYRLLASATHREYEATQPELRQAWSRMGTSVSSARLICEIASDIADWLSSGDVACEDAMDAVAALTHMDVWSALLGLPERPRDWQFRKIGSVASSAVNVNPEEFIRVWLNGDSLPSIASNLFAEVTDRARALELAVFASSDFCEHYFAWLISILVERVNALLRARGSMVLMCPELGVYVRHGVRNQMAIELLTAGIRSRELANAVATEAASEGVDGLNLRDWLGNLDWIDWPARFDASSADLLDLLEYSRPRGSSLLREILSGSVVEIDCGSGINNPLEISINVTLTRMGVDPNPKPIEISMAQEDLPSLFPVVPSGQELRGSVPTRHQDNLQQILLSGLDVRYSLNGTVLSISLERDIDSA